MVKDAAVGAWLCENFTSNRDSPRKGREQEETRHACKPRCCRAFITEMTPLLLPLSLLTLFLSSYLAFLLPFAAGLKRITLFIQYALSFLLSTQYRSDSSNVYSKVRLVGYFDT